MTPRNSTPLRIGKPTAACSFSDCDRARGKLASRITSGIQAGLLGGQMRPGSPTPWRTWPGGIVAQEGYVGPGRAHYFDAGVKRLPFGTSRVRPRPTPGTHKGTAGCPARRRRASPIRQRRGHGVLRGHTLFDRLRSVMSLRGHRKRPICLVRRGAGRTCLHPAHRAVLWRMRCPRRRDFAESAFSAWSIHGLRSCSWIMDTRDRIGTVVRRG